MRDDYYRDQCYFRTSYDKVIDVIKEKNVYIANMTEEEKEEFASEALNACIRSTLSGNSRYCSTGGALAVRVGDKVDVAITPCW